MDDPSENQQRGPAVVTQIEARSVNTILADLADCSRSVLLADRPTRWKLGRRTGVLRRSLGWIIQRALHFGDLVLRKVRQVHCPLCFPFLDSSRDRARAFLVMRLAWQLIFNRGGKGEVGSCPCHDIHDAKV